jgi:L-seryl-tRNA(Ser) seleniumtransferase
MVGGGSLPGETLPSSVWAVSVDHPQTLLAELRKSTPAIIGRIENDRVVFDPRTILPQSDSDFIQAFKRTWSSNEK